MKHKAKSFIAVLLALCLMMSLGVGALADNESDKPAEVGNSESGSSDKDEADGSSQNEPTDQKGPFTITVNVTGGTADVSMSSPAEGVTKEDGKTTAEANTWVFLTVKPEGDYTVSVSSDDCSISTFEDAKNQYGFLMPSKNVTISVNLTSNDDPEGGDEGEGDTTTDYSITSMVTVQNWGTVNLTKTSAKQGEVVTFTVSPANGYELAMVQPSEPLSPEDIKIDSTKDPIECSFNMPAANVTINVIFREIEGDPGEGTGGKYKIIIADNIVGGNVTVEDDKTEAATGETVYIIATPDKGYTLLGLRILEGYDGTIENDGAGKYHFSMPANDVKIGAFFQATGDEGGETTGEHSITANVTPDEGGDVELSQATADEGDEVTFTVKPSPGYEMDGNPGIYGLDSTITNHGDGSYTFIMEDEDVTITVAFKQVAYAINVTQPANGKVSTKPAAMAAAGTTVTLSAVPDKGYVLDKYIVTDANGDPVTVTNGQFKMPESAVTVTATFKPKQDQPDWSDWYDVDTWSNSVHGGISVGDDADMALAGSEVTFRVWHNYKYDYYDYDVYVLNDRTGARVSLDYSAYYDRYSFTMPNDDVTIYVYFDYAGRYSITKDVEGDGSIYVRSSADKGDTVWIEASPSAGQSLTSLRVFYGEPWAYGDKGYYGYWDEAEVKYSTYWDAYYFTMPADDVVVYARFTDGATVDVIAGDHGDAKVSSRYAEKGDWVYITAYPDEGYEVDSVTVTDSLGRSVKVTELSYDYFLFTMPGTSVDVKVTFRAKDYDVFYDVSRGDWYYKAVRFVHEKGIMEGTGTHYFSPEADLSRGMLATILYRLEGSPSVSGYSGFSDVADTAYYAKAVAWAKANGIVNGVTATAYEPDTAVTREELAAILCRYAAFKGKDTAISYDYLAGFSDANTSHVYARPALNWAVAYDIINGQGNGVLAPRATATRAEVAQVLMNYLEVFD